MATPKLSPAEQLLLTTIRIETTTEEGISLGTGFFFELKRNPQENTAIPVIVTNKHVVRGSITGKLLFSLKDADGTPLWDEHVQVELDEFEKRWVMHPEEDVDLCVLPIANIHTCIRESKKELLYVTLTPNDIPTPEDIKKEFSRIEDITIVGYPDGIWDSINNIPIVRKGITATPLQVDFENTPRFIIDAAIYGGSSGSPVFVFNQGTYYSPTGVLNFRSRIKLVGIIYAVAQHAVSGELTIVDIPAVRTPVAKTMIPNNLGIAIHARKLLDFKKLF